jgi:hypothetical protein
MLQGPIPPPQRITEIAYGFWQSKALFSAIELNVFTILADGSLGLGTLTSRVGIHQRGARDFLDALVALGILDRDAEGHYSNTPESDLYLVEGKPTYIGAHLKHLNARHYQNWAMLTRALVSGEPQSTLGKGNYNTLYADETQQELFLSGMTAGTLLAARTLAKNFPWNRYQSLMDVGTAQGCLPVEIARVHPHLRAGGFDLPTVEPVFAGYVTSHGMSDRVTFHPGDFLVDQLPTADVLVMGRILHNWDDTIRTMLLSKAYRAVAPGGALIVYDPLIGAERRNDPHGLLSSLNMLIETPGGSEYTVTECQEWMTQAGFEQIKAERLLDMHTAVIGLKLH